MYSIKASVCGHHIRYSTHLPWSGSDLDFEVQYCQECKWSQDGRCERDSARRDYESTRERYEARHISNDEYRQGRRAYDTSRLRVHEDERYWEERDDRERRATGRPTLRDESRRYVGLDDPELVSFRREVAGYGRTARFEDEASHRRESQYRPQSQYRRSSTYYRPGAHSSTHEYENTSGYEGRRRSSRSSRRERSESPRRERRKRPSILDEIMRSGYR